MNKLPDALVCCPAVYAVGKNYVITVPVRLYCYMWAKVGENEYYDESNGVLCHSRLVHKITVPMSELDAAKEYTLFWRLYPEMPESPGVANYTFKFRPVDPAKEKLNFYHAGDVHGYTPEGVLAGRYFEAVGEDMDFLIFNGDIYSTSNKFDNYPLIHKMAGDITGGEIPVVLTRGNHELGGTAAGDYAEYMPVDEEGHCYYTFRLGPVWGIALDVGNDLPDGYYPGVYSDIFQEFRGEVTLWLEDLVNTDEPEYLEEGIKYRIIVCHVPFATKTLPPRDVDVDLFKYWCKLFGEHIKPDFILCAHKHIFRVSLPGDELDDRGQPCPVIIATGLETMGEVHSIGCAMTLEGDTLVAKYTDDQYVVRDEATVELKADYNK